MRTLSTLALASSLLCPMPGRAQFTPQTDAGSEAEAEPESGAEGTADSATTTATDDDEAGFDDDEAGFDDDEAGFEDEGGFDDPDDAAGFGDPDDAAGFGGGDDAAGFGGGDDAAGFGGGNDSAGFGGSAFSEPEPASEPGTLTGTAFFRTREALWVEQLNDRPLAKARQSFDVNLRYKKKFRLGDERLELRLVGGAHFEYDLAYQHDPEDFDQATLDTYEKQLVGGETFLGLSYGPLELTVGRQIVAWGHGEALSPVDVVNPRDNREPGLSDLEDIRLAVFASRLGLFFGDHRIEGMIIHEAWMGLRPSPLSFFSPFAGILADDPNTAALIGDRGMDFESVPGRWVNQAAQYLGRYEYSSSAADIGFYAASTLDKQGVQCIDQGNPDCIRLTEDEVILKLYHPRYTMLGHAGTSTAGSFVLRWEFAAELDRPVSANDVRRDDFNLAILQRDQLIGMLGATYSRGDAQVGLEYQQAYMVDNPDQDADSPYELFFPASQPLISARYTQTFMREALRVTVAALVFGVSEFLGFFARAEFTYELRDGLKVGAGYAHYLPAEDRIGPFYGFGENDRLFVSLRWDFLLN